MRAWLQDPDWSWRLQTLSQHASAGTGVAVFAVDYDDRDAQGKPYQMKYILSLVFAKQGNEWRLVHDQNTRLVAP